MFGKYFVHELKNSYKMPAIICGICLGLSLICGLFLGLVKFDLPHAFEEFIGIFAVLGMLGASFAIGVTTIIVVFKSFSGRLFNQQGYLTLTLPVSTHTILISKILVSLIYIVAMSLSAILMWYLFFQGLFVVLAEGSIFPDIREVFKYVRELFAGRFDVFLLFALESFLSLLASLMFILFLCSFSHIGMSKGKRTLFVALMIIGYYILISMLSSGIFSEIVPKLYFNITAKEYALALASDIKIAAYEQGFMYITVLDFPIIVLSLAGIFGFYFLSHYIVENKLDIY